MDKIKELTDFYMWMQENDYDHNIRARVERKAEMYLKNETHTDANNVLPAVYPLINNRRWYAENGTVYNSGDDKVKIVILFEDESYCNMPHEIAMMISSALNSR